MDTKLQPAIVIHGGAWAIPDNFAEASKLGVQIAAKIGYKILHSGGSALDAVEAAVCSLEDDPVFDAGRGSTLNEIGEVEMDAVIMEGSELRAGSVAAVQNIRNPVKLARLVMERTDHCVLVGKGANMFAEEMGIEEVSVDSLVTDSARHDWEHYKKFKVTVNEFFCSRGDPHDTVGAVAVDCHGNVACATSTGGITAKRVGRVGDSPIIGSGAYCDNNYGAASATGHGENIMKVTLSRHVLYLIQQGLTPQAAADKSIEYMFERVKGTGGVIVVGNKGDIGYNFNTKRMAWASLKCNTLKYGLNPGDEFVSDFNP
ncbi:isoaspartyl peptidase/L-asparaginase-like [Saccoglossus kowalevskii]|uniref:Isoaspartyl peptidase/L-asparaginase-like n=1 Tax=Saccoglossus kowalevskii TaxID=10224 RepID=A0ABM0GJJ3_SACKO|nr:PREDICTED: isoaspartyl peptidase/L-asparaginase-like [Saccoglossus kowalevskii]